MSTCCLVVVEAKWISESFWGRSQGNWIVCFELTFSLCQGVFSCREPRYPDFVDLEQMLVSEGKMRRDQLGTYLTNYSPVHDFLEEDSRGVWWSETTPPRPFIVNWRHRQVDVLCSSLPIEFEKEVC